MGVTQDVAETAAAGDAAGDAAAGEELKIIEAADAHEVVHAGEGELPADPAAAGAGDGPTGIVPDPFRGTERIQAAAAIESDQRGRNGQVHEVIAAVAAGDRKALDLGAKGHQAAAAVDLFPAELTVRV